MMRISAPGDAGLLMTFRPATKLQADEAADRSTSQKVVKMRQRGLLYPYEIIKMLTPSGTETRKRNFRRASSGTRSRCRRPSGPGRHVPTARTRPTSSSA